MSKTNIAGTLVGSDILSLITSGMYNNPLAIYREYIQNSVDAIAANGEAEGGTVEIHIDPVRLCVRIRDNGPGLSYEASIRALLPIARSQKRRKIDRGFRGIGRLSGLAFAESVSFLTRAHASQPVNCITWHGPSLHNQIRETKEAESVIEKCVGIEKKSGEKYPNHFFEVQINGIARYAANSILNKDAVRSYISEVCPVPMNPLFPFVSEVDSLFAENESPATVKITINDENHPVVRQHGETIKFSEAREDAFVELEKICVPSAGGTGNVAIGWIAHSFYLGAIPKTLKIRGVRARMGNIQIGDEAIFDHIFPEERFNRWCVGEIYITDPNIVPNGRWDYFEPGPHTRNLENHLGLVARNISMKCRKASIARNKVRKFQAEICKIEETYKLASSGYLLAADAKDMIAQALNQIESFKGESALKIHNERSSKKRLDELEKKLQNFKAKPGRPPFGRGLTAPEIAAYRKVFRTLTKLSPSPNSAKKMIETILAQD